MAPRSTRDQLIEDHTTFVRRVVMKTVRVLSLPQKNLDDYLSAGYLGLVEAAERFEERKGASFKSYAYLRVRGAIIDHIRAHSEIKGAAYRRVRAMRSMDLIEEVHSKNLGTGTDSEKLASIFNMAAMTAMSFRLNGEESQAVFDEMPSECKDPEEALIACQDMSSLKECVKALPDRERFIVEEHYFRGRSFSELLSERPELSKSWLSRLHARALMKLTHLMEERCNEAA